MRYAGRQQPFPAVGESQTKVAGVLWVYPWHRPAHKEWLRNSKIGRSLNLRVRFKFSRREQDHSMITKLQLRHEHAAIQSTQALLTICGT
jgi:hypothetical protein